MSPGRLLCTKEAKGCHAHPLVRADGLACHVEAVGERLLFHCDLCNETLPTHVLHRCARACNFDASPASNLPTLTHTPPHGTHTPPRSTEGRAPPESRVLCVCRCAMRVSIRRCTRLSEEQARARPLPGNEGRGHCDAPRRWVGAWCSVDCSGPRLCVSLYY